MLLDPHSPHFFMLLQDVQFFREATDVQFDETGNRKRKHRYGDEDEIEMEQQERRRGAMFNKEVKAFAEKIAEAASTSVSFPARSPAFTRGIFSAWGDTGTGHSFPRAVL
jgi:nucleosome binding factor SPN SPT16 subunit